MMVEGRNESITLMKLHILLVEIEGWRTVCHVTEVERIGLTWDKPSSYFEITTSLRARQLPM